MLNKRGGPNKQGGLVNFFVYYMKNNGEGVKFLCLLHEKQGEVSKFLKLNKRVYRFFRHLRVYGIYITRASSDGLFFNLFIIEIHTTISPTTLHFLVKFKT